MNLVNTAKTIFQADGKPIITELGKIEGAIASAKEEQAKLSKFTKEYADLGKEISKLSAAADSVRESMGLQAMTMGQLVKLQKDLNAEYKQFGTNADQLKQVNTRISELRAETSSTFKTVNDSETTWSKLKGWMTTAFSVAAVIEAGRILVGFAKDVFDVGAKFEKYQVVLTKAMQSQEKANKAMADLQKLAASTPFTLDELTGSYVKFVNRGVIPSMESMTKMGDVAASQGKSFDQLTEAILDAGTGEFERLKEFGISAKKSGDQVELSFKGVHKTVKLTPEAMQGAIESFGDLSTVSGMMAETMATGEGKVSNLEDKLDSIKVQIYQGLSPVFKSLLGGVSNVMDVFINLIDWTKKLYNSNQPLIDVISSLFRTVGNLVSTVWDAVSSITGMNKASDNAQKFLNGLKIVFGLVASAAAVLVGTIGLVIDGLRFMSGNISFAELRANTTKNFSEIGKSLKATFVDDPKKIQGESKKAGEDLGKAQGDGLGAGQKKAQGETHKELSAKEKKHREDEAKKAKDAAEKLAKEELDVRVKLANASDKVWFDSIDDQWEKKRLAIIREYEKDWETQKNLVGDKKELQAAFAEYELTLAKNRDLALEKLAKEKADKEEKDRTDKAEKEKVASDKKLKQEQKLNSDIRENTFDAQKAILERELANKNLSVKARKDLEFQLENLVKENQLAKLKEKYDAEVANRIGLGQNYTDLTTKYEAEKAAIEGKFRNEKLEAEKTLLQKITETTSMFFEGIKAMAQGDFQHFSGMLAAKFNKETEHHTASQQKWGQKTQEIGQIVAQGIEAMSALSIAHFEMREAKINKDAETQKAKFKEQFQSGAISKEQYDAEIVKIDRDTAWKIHQEREREFKRQKAMQISMAVIGGIQAGIMAFATLGPIGGAIAAGILAIGVGAQINRIRNQPGPTWEGGDPPTDMGGISGDFNYQPGQSAESQADPSLNLPAQNNPYGGDGGNPYQLPDIEIGPIAPIDIGPISVPPIPGFKNGGKFAKGGLAKGPLHRDGGIWMWNPQTRQKVGELEGDEFIVNRESTAANLGLLSAINNRSNINRIRNSSFNRTGIPTYADGGLLGSAMTTSWEVARGQANNIGVQTMILLANIGKAISNSNMDQNEGLNALIKLNELTAKATGMVVKNTDATAKNTDVTAKNTDATAKNTNALVDPIRESANNSRQLGGIAQATRDTANKNFAPNISIINQQLGRLADIENSARL